MRIVDIHIVLAELKRYSRVRRILLGRAVHTEQPTKVVNGLVVFDLPPDSPVVTSSRVKSLESEF
jgi:hypothetical protein